MTCVDAERPKVSVVIPVFNAGKYLRETIESVLRQTFVDYELILVNDGSTDNSQEIIDYYASLDKRIIALKTVNSGAPKARNKGLSIARGSYIYFFDADDVMLDEAIERMYPDDDDVDLVIGKRIETDSKGRVYANRKWNLAGTYYPKYREKGKDIGLLFKIDPFPGNKLISKRFLDENGICFEEVGIGQDLNIYLKILSVCKRIEVIAGAVCRYRMHQESMVHRYDERILDIDNSLKGAEEYAKKNYADEMYYIDLYNVFIQHYYLQMIKCPYIKEKQLKKRAIKKIAEWSEETANKLGKDIFIENVKRLHKIRKMGNHISISSTSFFAFSLSLYTNGVLLLRKVYGLGYRM